MKRFFCLLLCLALLPVWSFSAASAERGEISILFVGNSLTQDGIAYLPYLLKTYWPDVSFKFYLFYNGGNTLGEQGVYFRTGQSCDLFSKAENEAAWSHYEESISMDNVLESFTFDIVCMQEYFTPKEGYTEADISEWNGCRDYIVEHYKGGNPLEFISLVHAPARENIEEEYQKIVDGNRMILQDTPSDDIIPMGTAIFEATNTILDELGDKEHLSVDGIHAQDGLPCLIQTYVVCCWLFDRLGMNATVLGCPARITPEILEGLSIPGSNPGTGVITGADWQNELAQEIAVESYKKGMELFR